MYFSTPTCPESALTPSCKDEKLSQVQKVPIYLNATGNITHNVTPST
jgi:hypothetical protein